MTRIFLSGCNGKMGGVIASCVQSRNDCQVVAGADINAAPRGDFPVFPFPAAFNGECDVIIDFSHPNALPGLLDYALGTGTPLVMATTGFNDSHIAQLKAAADRIPVFFSFNMSLGINLLVSLAQKAAVILPGFDIEIVESHHNQKIDAPSGTAIMLADGISSALPQKPAYEYDRHSKRKKRPANEIGIHSVRGGTIVGEHEVVFAGHDEVITLKHTAFSKEIFAVGAINAALFLSKMPAGFYSMKDLVDHNDA